MCRADVANLSLEEKAQALIKGTPTEVVGKSTPWYEFLHPRQESKFKHLSNGFLQTYKSLYQRVKAAYVPGEKGVTEPVRTLGFITLPMQCQCQFMT